MNDQTKPSPVSEELTALHSQLQKSCREPSQAAMDETPRTDALYDERAMDERRVGHGAARLCRQLERELTAANRALETERAELASVRVQLTAWHNLFGTSQLTHAIAARDRERAVRRQLAEDMENLCVPYTESKKSGLPSGVYVQRFRFEKAESALAASRALDQEVCQTMERPKKDCGCPDCGPTLVDYKGE